MNRNYAFMALLLVTGVILGGIFIINNINTNIKLNDNASSLYNSADRTADNQNNQPQNDVKEFKMDSFYEMVDDQPKPQYSLTEIAVKKGDLVRIEVTVTKGAHDFNIDEYNISKDTPLNQPTIIEFKADKAGEFVYYCSKPGHRQNGHWGTLKVIE